MNILIQDALFAYLKESDPLTAAERIFGRAYLHLLTPSQDGCLLVEGSKIKLSYDRKRGVFVHSAHNGSFSYNVDVASLADLGKLLSK